MANGATVHGQLRSRVVLDRLRQMLIKEFLQALRDPRMRAVILVVPVVQLLVFGYAASNDVRDVATAVLDLDGSQASRDLVERFAASGRFRIVARLRDDAAVARTLDDGTAKVVLRLNHGFEAALLAGRTAPVQVLVDGTDATTAAVALGYAAAISRNYGAAVAVAQAQRRGSPAPGADLNIESRAWFNDNLESRLFFVPGVLGLLVTLVTLMLSSMAIVREKEIGTMEQIMVSPIRPAEFILGKTLPFLLIGAVDVVLVVAVAVLWFEVPFRGSPPLLALAMALFMMTTLGCGLLISTVCETQQQAMITTFFFFMPAMLLSGFAFPIANMPRVIQWLTLVNPLRHLLVIIWGIFLKGVGYGVLWPQLLALASMGSAILLIASLRLRKTSLR
jgi:ABC-2 type transport system permease protein